MKEYIIAVIPELPMLDLDETRKFYVEKLGFVCDDAPPNFLIVSKDDFKIHFWLTNDKDLCASASCYLRVRNIEGLYEDLKSRGVLHPNVNTLEHREWGMKECYVVDNNGNLLKFGEPIRK